MKLNRCMKLNKEQYKAAVHLNGPMLVLAGPGSGKTHLLVERIRMKCSERYRIRIRTHTSFKPDLHFAGGFSGKRYDKYRGRIDAGVFYHHAYSLNEKMRLSASGARKDEHRAV